MTFFRGFRPLRGDVPQRQVNRPAAGVPALTGAGSAHGPSRAGHDERHGPRYRAPGAGRHPSWASGRRAPRSWRLLSSNSCERLTRLPFDHDRSERRSAMCRLTRSSRAQSDRWAGTRFGSIPKILRRAARSPNCACLHNRLGSRGVSKPWQRAQVRRLLRTGTSRRRRACLPSADRLRGHLRTLYAGHLLPPQKSTSQQLRSGGKG